MQIELLQRAVCSTVEVRGEFAPRVLEGGEATVVLGGWLRRGIQARLRAEFFAHVGEHESGRVLRVVSEPASDSLAAELKKVGASTTIALWENPARMRRELPALGTYDAVLIEPPGDEGLVLACLQMVSRVEVGGRLLLHDVEAGSPLLSELLALRAEAVGGQEPANGRRRLLQRRSARVDVDFGPEGAAPRGDVLIVVRHPTFVRVGESEINAHLGRCPSAGRVLSEVPEATLVNTSHLEQSPSDVQHERVEESPAPPLFLREYNDVTAWPRQIVVQAGVVLPDSFRKPLKSTPSHKTLRQVGEQMVTFSSAKAQPQPLAGSYFYLDSEFRGHFGHAITEQLSRLWAWALVKEHDPDAKCLMLSRRRRDQPAAAIREFERILYGAAGVDAGDLVLVEGPVRVERMYAATPAFAQPQFVHPTVADVWREAGDRLASLAGDNQRPRRIFCGRKHDKRACHNAAEVERLFAEHGFTVVYPEEHSLPDQVAMFREAEVVGGYAGSALFTAMFLDRPTHLIMVSSETYSAENEYRIAAVLGHRVSVAWCRSDLTRGPGRGFVKEVFHSDYTFDFGREGVFLKRVLAEL